MEGAQNVLRLLSRTGVGVRRMPNCALSEKRKGEESKVKVFVGNLNLTTEKSTLEEYFGRWGRVLKCGIVQRRTDNMSAGFGFCTFDSPEVAKACVAHGVHVVDGANVTVRPYKMR